MINKYTVIKKFGCAEPNDEFKFENDINEYCMVASTETDNFFSSRTMCISPSIAEEYAKEGFLKAEEEKKPEAVCANCATNHAAETLDKVKNEISRLKEQYNKRKDSVEKKYAAGKMPTCQKVEHDTVYFNLMKVLEKFENLINE